MESETPTAASQPAGAETKPLENIADEWHKGHHRKAIFLLLLFGAIAPYSFIRVLLTSGFFWGVVLSGIGLTAIAALGQCWSIGFHAAWAIYKYWWLAAPLYGPAMIAATLVPIGILKGAEWGIRRAGKPQYANAGVAVLLASGIGVGLLVASYYGTREDNPLLSSQPANLDALKKAVGDQNRVLGNLSESGESLLGQLNATETELENAKKQLSATLTNFEAQRQAAGRVSEELKGIDARQRAIALQTEALERILEGQRPLTQQDLQRANWYGQVWGFLVGFAASLLASIVYSTFKKSSLLKAQKTTTQRKGVIHTSMIEFGFMRELE